MARAAIDGGARLARALSNRNVSSARFEVADFDGAWLASFGRPELRGAWLIHGKSGGGKTHLALMLLKYLCRFVDRVAYDTLEQGLSLSFQNAWRDAGMSGAGSRVIVLDRESIDDLRARLRRRKSPGVVVIDSITALEGFTRPVFTRLTRDFPGKLFIFVAHEEGGRPYPAIANHVHKLAEVKARVEGYKAFVSTRFRGGDGEGGAEFVIWEEGAARYWVDKL
ncbi:MAG: ATP-binding protein [Odoribacteraceae bacterium]|jgi:hypothetical protein|nr:ATP-binding protein [Odoribacteraceae bacterium]